MRIAPGLGLGLALLTALAGAHASELDPGAERSLERLVATRGFTRGLPRAAMPSPEGRRAYFLRSGPRDVRQELWMFEAGETRLVAPLEAFGGEAVISAEEQARRERQRQTERGITSFEVSRDGRWLWVPYSGDLYRVEVASGTVERLTETAAAEIDAHGSPDATRVSYVRGASLYVLEIQTGIETPIAQSDDPDIGYGIAEFVAQEEMGRATGSWWSPDSRLLALTRVDTRAVPRFRVPDFDDPTGEGHESPYPKAGDPNAVVALGVAPATGGDLRWFELPAFEYLARVDWSPDSRTLWVQTQPRSQKQLDLVRVDVATGTARRILQETDPYWVNLHDDFRWLDGGQRFLWSSERTGHRHLEVVRADGRRERTLTSGDWSVRSVVHVDEKAGHVYFTGHRDGVLEQHLYRVSWSGGAVRRLSVEPGWHDATFHPHGGAAYVSAFSNASTPGLWRFHRPEAPAALLPAVNETPEAAELGDRSWMRLPGADGTPLDVLLTLPPDRVAGRRWPLVLYVYAGPGAQQVRRAWPGERGCFDVWLAARGFAVARIDGRGVRARGHASERIFAGQLGSHELEDQVAGVRALLDRVPELDPQRVGVWGWSYGGTMTLQALFRAADLFQAGVAVAPVVDWRGYDTHYTERYLGHPDENAAGYASSAPTTHVGGMSGYLELVHGATDDNVHFRESMLLVRALVEHGKRFDLMVYPGTHMIESLQERMHLYELVWRTFRDRLD